MALLAAAPAEAQTKHPPGKKPVPEKNAKPARPPKVSLSATRSTPSEKGSVKGSRAKLAAQAWKGLTGTLLVEYLARNPERACERAWPEVNARHLGTFGSSATLRWREALTDAHSELELLGTIGLPPLARAQLGALADWLAAELLLLDGLMPSTSDPAGYVQRAFRTLQAASEARWLPLEQRQAELALLLQELPAYFRDARISLVDPAQQWIDLALLDLDDLQELLGEIEASLPAKPAPKVPRNKNASPAQQLDSRSALESFRAWLLELRPSAGCRPPCLDANEWQRLVRLRSGTTKTTSEIKAQCLRELARLDLAVRMERSRSRGASESGDLAQQAWTASTRALRLGQEARLLRPRIEPQDVEFALETSPRMRPELAWLRPGGKDSMRVILARPHGSWPPERMITRNRSLENGQAALGVRYGLAGEALAALQSGKYRGALAMLLDNRLMQEGLGLFALDWAARVDWIENPFRPAGQMPEEPMLEFQFQRGLEAARLVAALELHAEGHSLEEAAQGFQRRTGVDQDTARVEALAAQRDPLHGLGYLGLIELRRFEDELSRLTGPRKGLRLSLLFASRYPDLRPADMVTAVGQGPASGRKKKGMTAATLEKPREPQQEHSLSR